MRIVEVEVDAGHLREIATKRGDEDTRTEVVLVLPRPGGKVLLISKPFYPEGTFRLPSGGMKPGETPDDAFRRECLEETGLHAQPMATIETMLLRCRCDEERVDITSHVILGSPSRDIPRPLDLDEEICAYREIEPARLRELAARLSDLPGRWRGWGLFRAPAHLAAADYLTARHPERSSS